MDTTSHSEASGSEPRGDAGDAGPAPDGEVTATAGDGTGASDADPYGAAPAGDPYAADPGSGPDGANAAPAAAGSDPYAADPGGDAGGDVTRPHDVDAELTAGDDPAEAVADEPAPASGAHERADVEVDAPVAPPEVEAPVAPPVEPVEPGVAGDGAEASSGATTGEELGGAIEWESPPAPPAPPAPTPVVEPTPPPAAIPVVEPAPPAGAPPSAAPPAAPPGPPPSAPEERSGSWAVRITLVLGILVVLAVLAFVGVVVASRGGPGPEPARAEAEAFVRAWSAGDTAGMQTLVEPAAAPVAADIQSALGALGVTRTTVTLVPGPLAGQGDDRTANVTVELNAPELPPITYPHTIPFRKVAEDTWRVVWSRAVIHPLLTTPERKFDRTSTWAPRATLLDDEGQPLGTVPGQVTIMVRPANVVDRPGLEAALAAQLGIDAATVDKAFTAARATGEAPIKTLSWTEYVAVRDVIRPIGGLRFPTSGGATGIGGNAETIIAGKVESATPERAAELGEPYEPGDEVGVSGLQASQQKTLGGLPATEVRIVDGAGTVVQPITRIDGSPPTNVRTTINRKIQAAAESALASGIGKNGGGLVVIDRTGGIKALANPPRTDFSWATAQYPPGSTMKVVTAEALLAHGLGPDSQLTCPPVITAAGQPYRNFEGETEPSLNFTRAFTISCNTAFIGAAQQLSGAEMTAAVGRFGFNVDYDIGIPMKVRGSFPDDGPGAARSSMAIGQGNVLTNPVHMASVVATVMTGQWRAPSLLADRPADLPVGTPLDPRVRNDLEGFMRSVVENGSATAASVPGKVVYGKTGTAEHGAGSGPDLPTHAWFVGFSGDLAIAIVVDNGGVGGRVAAPIANAFFSQV